MNKRWEVVAIHRSMYEGLDPAVPCLPYESSTRSQHHTWIGADFYRRFRGSYMTMGSNWIETAIVPTVPHVPFDVAGLAVSHHVCQYPMVSDHAVAVALGLPPEPASP